MNAPAKQRLIETRHALSEQEARKGSPCHPGRAVFSPWTDLALTGSSHTDVAIHDPVFRPEVFVMLAANYLGDANPKDIRAAPIFGVPDGLPPLAIQVGSDELLLDDARCYAVLAAAKGGEVRLDVFEGCITFFNAVSRIWRARAGPSIWRQIFLRRIGLRAGGMHDRRMRARQLYISAPMI